MNTPCVLRETSEGSIRLTIEDVMLENREINLTGTISKESVNDAILQLRYLQRVDPKGEITIFINSPGGEVSSGLALYDVMRAVSCPIRTVCMGMAASMGSILFIAGDKREILPHARVMIHDPLISGGVGGSALSMDAMAKDLMKIRQISAEVIARHSGHTVEEVLEKTCRDTYFDAEEAVAWGLADQIVTTV